METLQNAIQTAQTAKFNDTRCIGVIISGAVGRVTITKRNKKSFSFDGTVGLLENGRLIQTSGKAKFWKQLKDGRFAFKAGKAVLTLG